MFWIMMTLAVAFLTACGGPLVGVTVVDERTALENQVLGTYHEIGEYMTAIGSLPRIVKASEVKVNTDQPATEPGESPLLRAIFRIETFIVPDPGMVVDTAAVGEVANANG